MLSILPKHVADEMLKDMKKDESQKDQQQFNTMYMYRHENVRCDGGECLGPVSGLGQGGTLLHGISRVLWGAWFSQGLEARPPRNVHLGSPEPSGRSVAIDGRVRTGTTCLVLPALE